MATQVFVHLPSTDLERSKAFYTALGASINPLFTDENAASVVFSDDIYLMVLTRDFFQTFTNKPLSFPLTHAQTIVSFNRDSREHVDATVEAGLRAGGKEPKEAQDLGFMYNRQIEDPDGNILEFFYMSNEAAENGPPA